MNDYFSYLQKTLVAFFKNLGKFFSDVFAYPWAKVPAEFDEYHGYFQAYSSGFGGAGWFFFVLFTILFAALIGGLGFLIYKGLSKYIKFYKREVDKDRLIEEVEKLNLELYNATQEKNQILGLQVAGLGIGKPAENRTSNGAEDGSSGEKSSDESLRFPRLIGVDKKYETLDTKIVISEADQGISLEEICQRFRLFAASQLGLYYTLPTIQALFASMGTSKIIILEGISGTGKTSLPYALGRFFQNNAVICSVQPSWRDRTELLGFYNDFTHKFTETEFLRAIYETTYRQDPNIIVLDEMNLARIEYYFAEFLSIMEMPNVNEWNIDLISSPEPGDPKHLHDGKLLIPQNAWFIGTANNDDSTFTITDKVYDRAMSIFFDNKGIAFDNEFTESLALPYSYLEKLYGEALTNYPLSQKSLDKFEELDAFVIEKFKLAFGNRIMKQLRNFVPCYVACGGTELGAIDYIFSTKILKKFETLNIAFLRDELGELDAKLTKLFGKNEFGMSKGKIKNLLKMNG